MTDTTWEIVTRGHGTLTVSAITSDWPTLRRGSTQPIRLWFENPGSNTVNPLVVGDGETHTVTGDETYTYAQTQGTGQINVTTGTLTLTGRTDAYELLAQYLDYAGAAVTGLSQSNVPWYVDQLPAKAKTSFAEGGHTAIRSLAMGFNPSSDIQDRNVDGFWGVVVGGADVRNAPLTNYQLEFEVFVLAEFDEYDSHGEMADNHEA